MRNKCQARELWSGIQLETLWLLPTAVRILKFYGDVAYAEAEAAGGVLHVAKSASLASLIIEIHSQMVADLINSTKDKGQ